MTLLRQTLQGSWLLKPWMGLAECRSSDLARWLRNAKFLGPMVTLGRHLGAVHPVALMLTVAFRFILIVGLIGLFALLSFASTGVIGALTWLLFVLVLLGWWGFRPNVLARMTIIDLLVGAFLASALISTAFSSFLTTSVIGLAKMTTFVAGYVVFRYVSEQGRRVLLFLLGFLALLGLFEAAVGFHQHINHIQPLATWSDQSINPELQMDRIFGTLKPSNPNLLAGFLIPCLAAALGLSLIGFRNRTWLRALMLVGGSGAILAALVLTGSRGGFLAIATMFVSLFACAGHLIWHDSELKPIRWLKPAWLIVLVAGLLLMAGGLVGSEKIRTRAASIFAMREDSSISYRLNVYDSAMRMARDNPVVGIGPGNGTFKLVYGLYMTPGYNALGAYSVPLEIAVEQGAIGLAIFLSLLLVLALRAGLAIDSAHLTLPDKLLIATLLTAILGSFAYGAFDTIWYRPSVNLLFWFSVAMLARLCEPVEANVFRGRL